MKPPKPTCPRTRLANRLKGRGHPQLKAIAQKSHSIKDLRDLAAQLSHKKNKPEDE